MKTNVCWRGWMVLVAKGMLAVLSLSCAMRTNAAVTISLVGDGNGVDVAAEPDYLDTGKPKDNTYDIDGDEAFGTAGRFMLGATNYTGSGIFNQSFLPQHYVDRTPAWITVSKGSEANNNIAYGYSVYIAINHPTNSPASGRATNWGSGIISHMGVGVSYYELLTFNIGAGCPRSFRVGVLTGNSGTEVWGSEAVQLTGPDASSATVTNLATTGANWVFFDIDTGGALSGTFSVKAMNSGGNGSSIGGLVFDNPAAPVVRTYYWDINGTAAGAGGATPSGAWDGAANVWNSDLTGGSDGSFTNATATNNTLYFSAGTDATGGYTVDLSGTQNSGNITFEDGTATLTNGTLALGDAVTLTVNSGLSATIASTVSGAAASLTKAGAGTLILSGVNTYTGVTVVSNGTLQVNSSLAAASTTTVYSAATLGGTGLVAGAVIVTNNAILSPGDTSVNSGVGTIRLGNLNFATNAILQCQYNSTTADCVVVTNALTLPNQATVQLTQVEGAVMPASILLFSAGSISGTPNFSGWTVSGGSGTMGIQNGTNVVFTAAGADGTMFTFF